MSFAEIVRAAEAAGPPLDLVGQWVGAVALGLKVLGDWIPSLSAATTWASPLLQVLLRASISGGLFIALAWLLCRLWKRMPTALRASVWCVACVKLLLELAPLPGVPLRVLPPTLSTVSTAQPIQPRPQDDEGLSTRRVLAQVSAVMASQFGFAPRTESELSRKASAPRSSAAQAAASTRSLRRWLSSEAAKLRTTPPILPLVATYLALLLIGLARSGYDGIRVRRILRGASAELPSSLTSLAERSARRVGLDWVPSVLLSEDIRSPLATGFFRPVIVLPTRAVANLSAAELEMALVHEMVHIRRGDLLLGWIVAAAERLFFFHPLVWLAAREYAIAREAACDTEVLDLLQTAPQAYGRMLLRFGVERMEPRLATVSAASPLSQLKRRFLMLHDGSFARPRRVSLGLLLVASALALVPFRFASRGSAEAALVVDASDPVSIDQVEGAKFRRYSAIPAVAVAVAPAAPTPRAIAVRPDAHWAVAVATPTAAPHAQMEAARLIIPDADDEWDVVAPMPPIPPMTPHPPVAVYQVPGGARVYGLDQLGHLSELYSEASASRLSASERKELRAQVDQLRKEMRELSKSFEREGTRPTVEQREALRELQQALREQLKGYAKEGHAMRLQDLARLDAGYDVSTYDGANYDGMISSDDEEDEPYVLFREDWTSMCGNRKDLKRARKLRDGEEDLLWFKRDGKEYVSRDAELIEELAQVFEAQGEIGEEQGSVGQEQGEIGARQGELGGRQAVVAMRMANNSMRLAELEARREGTRKSARRDEIDEQISQIEDEQQELQGEIDDISGEQEDLAHQQEALGERQSDLGEKQEEATREARTRTHDLMEQAIDSGAAQPVK